MKRVWSNKRFVHIIICFLAVLLVNATDLFGNCEIVEAACTTTKTCSSCNGMGYTVKDTTFSTMQEAPSGFKYKSRRITTGCTNCGGKNTVVYVYASATVGVGASEQISGADYKAGSGKVTVSTSCTWPSNYTESGNTRYKNCTKCSARLKTQYYLSVSAGTGINSVSGAGWYDSGAKVNISCTPKTGYKFSKWSDNATSSSRSITMDKAKSFTAYGVGISYTVKYNKNGGDGGSMADSLHTYSIASNLRANAFTKTGYTFAGWNTKSDGTGTNYTDKDSVSTLVSTDGGSITLYAKWKANTYELRVSPNGGAFSDGTMDTKIANPNLIYNSENWCNLVSFVPTRKGYTFAGFYTAISNGTKVYDEKGACIKGTAYWNSNKKYCYANNLMVYARWNQNEYKVTYHANGGFMESTEKMYHYNEQVDLSPTAEKEGKIFVGWSTDPNASLPLNAFSMPDLATSADTGHADWELTLYAVYSIPVSDVANHTYPEYEKKTSWEVFVRVYDFSNEKNYRDYELKYTIDTNTMVYKYVLDSDISGFVGNMEAYYYKVYAYDNVRNWNVIYEDVVGRLSKPELEIPKSENPTPKTYRQMVKHYKYNPVAEGYEKLTDDVGADVKEGDTYTPSFVTVPKGYEPDYIKYPNGYEEAGKIINGAYQVTEQAISEAYYKPCKYKLTFDANGGKIEVNSILVGKKTGKITYSDRYENVGYDEDGYGFPTPTRAGYTFVGWYTQVTDGVKVKGSDKYLIAGDSTLYAHWQKNSYIITYDDWTNGGTGATMTQKKYDYGAKIDLSITAQKSGNGLNGWEFVGWNTDPNANIGLSELFMPARDMTVYAIFKKDISVITIERDKKQTVTTKQTKTIYNNEASADFIISSMVEQDAVWDDWTLLGWTTETGAAESPIVGIGSTYTSIEDVTLYAVYISEVTLSYNTGGSSMVIESQTKECFYNASGDMIYPSFIVADAPILPQHSFVNWCVREGQVLDTKHNPITSCMPKDEIVVTKNTVLKTFWDKHPIIEAYDRYFTLEQAQRGEITQEELLEKVKATDEEAKSPSNEEGRLLNGTDVIVKDYSASDFAAITTEKEVEVTYQATDSFGNTVTKKVTITITDTSMRESTKENYVRFISSGFYGDENGNLVSSEKGGVEETSIWRMDENHRNLLQQTFFDENKKEEVWIFTMVDIKEMKEYTNTYGYIINGLEEFFERFYRCVQNGK